jgi:phosphoglycolate phosphatase
MRQVLLFDIDGTLIHAGGAGRRALEYAIALHCGELNGATTHLRLDGMTDRLIVREALTAMGKTFEDATCDRVLESYQVRLVEEIQTPRYQVLPGVLELLETLAGSGILLGLCTGNVMGGARLKLARGGLDRFFDWSDGGANGFASDGEARERILEAALRRASSRLGQTVDPRAALVVGDTPRDVEAARAVGVPVLGVATGRYPLEDLRACGADRVVENLADPGLTGWLLAG